MNTAAPSGTVRGYSTGGAAGAGAQSTSPVSGSGGGGANTTGATGGPTQTVGGAGASGTGSAAGSGTSSGTAPAAARAVAADTTHCAGSREFSPSIDYYAPPCTPGPVGPVQFNNGGSTYQGVGNNAITIVDYISDYGAEVNTILQAEGLLETYADGQVLDKAWQNFINSHYVLWGRQIHIVTYQGHCQSVPPDTSCLLAEMDAVVQTYHPYGVYWLTTLCSACFARLAADHVVAFGGEGFSDSFTDANSPYYYAATESSTHIEQAFAHWWCSQMSSANSNRVVTWAQPKNPAQNFNGQRRVLGIISTNDPDNENTVKGILVPLIKQLCGDTVDHFYFYDQNINTAAQQVEAGISAMDTTTSPATDVLCLCDPVAPQFLYEGEQQHNYWPENLLADVQGMTYDSASQNYEAGANHSSSLACPAPNVGCEFDNAFGVMATSPQENQSTNNAIRVFKTGGGGALPVTADEADLIWSNWEMMASLIENTGPSLTPARMQAAAPSMGTIGGGATGHYEVGFSPGNYNWIQDARVAYWDPNRASPYNGGAGTYVDIEGSRFMTDRFPSMSEPPIPTTRPA